MPHIIETLTLMINPSSRSFRIGLLSFLALAALSQPLKAEDVYVTSKKGTGSTIDDNPPLSTTTGSVSSSGSSAVSTVTPVPVIPASARKVRYGFLSGCSWTVQPTDITVVNSANQSYT